LFPLYFLSGNTLTTTVTLDENTLSLGLLGTILGYKKIYGLSVLGRELFIVRGDRQISVYNTHNFTWIRIIAIPGSSSLQAIIASSSCNCLYASDEELNLVHRYNLSNDVTTKWNLIGTCFGLSLSKIAHRNLFATIYSTNTVNEYTADGNLNTKIYLDISIERPYHSIRLSSNRTVLSHVGAKHRVCLVDTNGRILKSYGGPRGSGVGQLYEPGHLAVDRDGNVLVADCYNNRIVRLSPTLDHLGYVSIRGYQMTSPWALHLDELNNRLYIGEWTYNGRVFAVKI